MAKAVAPLKAQVNKYEDELAKFAVQAAAQEVVGGSNFISTRGGRLSFGGNQVPGDKMNVVVVASVAENHYYTDRFDAENPASPKCFAFSEDGGPDMAPHDMSEIKQHETCLGCPQNEWGTADTGRGKACKNIRRLGIITEDGLEDVSGAELAVLKIPVTSVKEWGAYVNLIANTLKRPPFAVVTEISIVPDPKTQFKLKFKLVGQIQDNDCLQQLMERRPTVLAELARPYQPTMTPEPAAPVAGGKPANKRKY